MNFYEFCALSVEYRITYHCAPVMVGIKTANTITLETHETYLLDLFFKGKDINSYCLWKDDKKTFILLYRRKLLEAKLKDKSILELLERFGYGGLGFEDKLRLLAFRFNAYKSLGADFPHELGLFLDYPICDVIGFIENHGRDCIACGYWKVYGDEIKAKEIFRKYDLARKSLISALESGFKLKEIIL